MDLNDEHSKMCRETNLDFITHKNINPRADLNKSRLHLNRNGSDKIGKTFVNLILKYYKWGHKEKCVKSSNVPSTSAQSQQVYISETNDVNSTKETNQYLRCLRIKNMKKLISN